MINTLVRPADLRDHQQLSNLVFFETRLHRHLDWRSPLEWLGAPFYWALEEGGQITAALACPEEIAGIAWMRLFVYTGRWSAENAWQLLWATARREIEQAGGARAAAIAIQPWFQEILAASGFENRQQIVLLEWRGFAGQPSAARETAGIRIRKMTEADLPEVEKTDAASFDPLWQNPLETLRRAFAQALYVTVAENEAGIIGYQLSTGGGQRAHLARLAVHPAGQGKGVGSALLSDLFTYLTDTGISRLSVNTQSDNRISLSLYQRMGFVRTGEQYPVYTFDIPARAKEAT
ncbi:MAG: GNAT family N-acetyltransferase [Anaerolineales bacterium]|nr:GNAT family N-acetyltransferase [Anaerolineales bacterium]